MFLLLEKSIILNTQISTSPIPFRHVYRVEAESYAKGDRTIGRESLPLRLLFQSILQEHSHSGLPSCAPSSLQTSTIYGAQIQAYPW